MIFRFILVLLLTLSSLFAEWKIDSEIEAGLFLPNLDGSISNVHGSSDFTQDYLYDRASASYFGVDLFIGYDYAPNFSFDYFNMQDNSDATLDKNVTVADGVFNSKVTTLSDFSVLNSVIYQDFKQKGKVFSLLGQKLYTGDIEFDVGLNIKYLTWNFEIRDQIDTTRPSSWIHVNELVPLPYIGCKYYLYGFIVHAEGSALSFVEAKAMNYQVALSYRVIEGLSLSGAYLYEHFEAVEKNDTVKFTASGYKASFLYAF